MNSFNVNNEEYKNLNFCSIFSLITSYNFLMNGCISKEQHNENLQVSKLNYIIENLKDDICFDKLLSYSNIDTKDINFTNPELINIGIITYEHMLLNDSKCIIFLKNFNFFVVLHTDDDKYCLRDSHNPIQYNFNNKTELINYLNNEYSFNKLTIINNYVVEEMSNIEYVILKNKFNLKLEIKSLDDYRKKKCLEEDNGLSIYFNYLNNVNTTPFSEFREKDYKINFIDIFQQ